MDLKSEAPSEEIEILDQGVHNYSDENKWVKPTDPIIADRLEWFMDQKLGLMITWGPYSQWGIVESWALCDEAADWARADVDWVKDSQEFKRQYFELNQTFNPVCFQPDVWADIASNGGFQYLIFITKHCDGFSLWDTSTTDYKTTDRECPFHTHRYSDVCKHVFDEFRKRDIAIGAYVSKADWHSPYYWAPGMENSGRTKTGPTYNPDQYPWLWNQYVRFFHEQVRELITKYGRIDILWLDDGWVSPKNGQDVRLGEIIAEARSIQPWLLTADRAVGGLYENYITPESHIPAAPISVPWECCNTIANGVSYSYNYDCTYKTDRELVHMLIDTISKGGNLVLNVGPQPDGHFPKSAIQSIKGLGEWLKVYGEAVYSTRFNDPYRFDSYRFVKKKNTVYCFIMYESDGSPVKEKVRFMLDKKVSKVSFVGQAKELEFTQSTEWIDVKLTDAGRGMKAPIADVLKLDCDE